jgi:hypothetical protein
MAANAERLQEDEAAAACSDMHLDMQTFFDSGHFYDCTLKVKADADPLYTVRFFFFFFDSGIERKCVYVGVQVPQGRSLHHQLRFPRHVHGSVHGGAFGPRRASHPRQSFTRRF